MPADAARAGLNPRTKRVLLSVTGVSTAIAALAFALSLLHPRSRHGWLLLFAVGVLTAMLTSTSLIVHRLPSPAFVTPSAAEMRRTAGLRLTLVSVGMLGLAGTLIFVHEARIRVPMFLASMCVVGLANALVQPTWARWFFLVMFAVVAAAAATTLLL